MPMETPALASLQASLDFWKCCANVAEIWWTRYGGVPPGGVAAHRLRALLRHARATSPLYRELHRGCGEHTPLGELPVVRKQQLMENFDDWCTDPRIRRKAVDAFLADRRRIGEHFLDRYCVWKSSGTSGIPGIFVQDAHALAVYDALVAAQFDARALGARGAARLASAGGRAAIVIATGDHFASITSWQHLKRAYPGMERREYSVLTPLGELVAQLNAYQPAMVASYPSVLRLLATEQAAGRLRIEPALLWSGGEVLRPSAQEAIERAFDCRVINEYGASECLSIAFQCEAGWMHVNSEWVILEGVDALGRAVPPGELSHTTLLTNLANWVQPIIRYDLGDRIVALPVPCACGSPLPAIRVDGRSDSMVHLRTASGDVVRLPPLALETVVEEAAGERRFQIAQKSPERLAMRLEPAGATEAKRVWKRASHALREYLAAQKLANVRLELDRAPPRIDERSGKLHSVVVEGP